jgi:thioredoxin reductase (NADPH)
MNNQTYDTVIIGSGPAGMTAAIYNVRSALKTVVIAGNQPGGQLTITTTVDNYPGFPNGIGGVKLMMDMQAQLKNLGGEIRNGVVKKIKTPSPAEAGVSPLKKGDFEIELDNGEKLVTKAVIVATGAGARWLGLPKEKELIGKGVSGCATCDGMFFRDKVVAVIGGGDVACEDADFLTKFANKVYLIHRRDQLRAQVPQKMLVERNPKIEFVWNSEVVEINPNPSRPAAESPLEERETNKLEGVLIKNVKTGAENILPVDGLFVAIGRTPATDFVKDLVEIKETGQIITGKNSQYLTMSSVPGIFAAGDCVDDIYRQGIIAAGDGAKAGLDAEKWLKMGD